MKPDLQTTADVQCIVDAFYTDITEDPVIGSRLGHMDSAHLPKLRALWSSVAFQRDAYRRRLFEEEQSLERWSLKKHAALEGLRAHHLRRWLQRFEVTVDTRYAGERAERMKAKARHIATIFQIKSNMHGGNEKLSP